MTRRDRRRTRALTRGKHRISAPQAAARTRLSIAFGRADRRALLLGTALASTLLIANIATPSPAAAQVTCVPVQVGPPVDVPAPPGPIDIALPGDSIDCVNVFDRNNGAEEEVILLQTGGGNEFIVLDNSGNLTATTAGQNSRGINAATGGANSNVTVTNSGDITAVSTFVGGVGTGIAAGINAYTIGGNSSVTVFNSGYIAATGYRSGVGISASVQSAAGPTSPITIVNSGDIVAIGTKDTTQPAQNANASGITAASFVANSPIDITNSGDIAATGVEFANGIVAQTFDPNSGIGVFNSGDITVTQRGDGIGDDFATGINVQQQTSPESPMSVVNQGRITATAQDQAVGINVLSSALSSDSPISIVNSADIMATGGLSASGGAGIGIQTRVFAGDNNPVTINNSASVFAKASNGFAAGIYALVTSSFGPTNAVTIVNSGDLRATTVDGYAHGIRARSDGSPISIVNSGSVFAQGGSNAQSVAGIYIDNPDSSTTITNSGEIGASNNLAILGYSGPVDIFNSGTITGFVLLDADDSFINQAGGTFEARQTSDFDAYGPGGGNDLFRNEAGATVHAVNENGQPTRFINLERFENQGLISTVDGDTGDSFTISNTPGGTDLAFAASGNSTLAVDARLAGPGNSASDTFTIEGNVSGVTTVQVNNTNAGPGVFNPQGIPVVFVTGATPNSGAFTMDPVDTGFFDYDLFFVPTGSGFWELRSSPGVGAYLLPQLVTAAQDIWHQSASTWFDRSADLRVLLAGGAAPAAYDPGGKSLSAAGPYPLTPAVWARGSGGWLDRDDTQRASAYGRNYTLDLDRDLDTIDFQVGVDMGKRDVWSQGDALVFGLLGGFVHGDLDYDSLARNFDFDGGQVGAYATYLNGGLFVDTLLNAHLYSLETSTLGFPSSLDANTIGLRTDTGYRFGSFSGGPFIEPLATLEVMWADIDGFSLGGNTVSFDDDANVRGRLGLRAGTTMNAWEGTLMEPFVIGSLWGNLTDDNQATLVSTGRTFRFEDQLEDVWGEVSAGVNFFNFSQTTAVFAKVDVTFGDDLTGVGGKAGMRVNW